MARFNPLLLIFLNKEQSIDVPCDTGPGHMHREYTP